MKLYIAIPTGQRTHKAVDCVRAWQAAGVHVGVYTWDDETFDALSRRRTFAERIMKDIRKVFEPSVDWLCRGERKSFGKLQNLMAREIPDWDVLICGADDLYPDKGTDYILPLAKKLPESVIWADDGLFAQQPTHAIITRQWWEKHGRQIFDEGFYHNFVDTDLAMRTSVAGELVKCFAIRFDHRHPFKTGEKKDALHRYGDRMFRYDEMYFAMKHDQRQIPCNIPEIQVAEALK